MNDLRRFLTAGNGALVQAFGAIRDCIRAEYEKCRPTHPAACLADGYVQGAALIPLEKRKTFPSTSYKARSAVLRTRKIFIFHKSLQAFKIN